MGKSGWRAERLGAGEELTPDSVSKKEPVVQNDGRVFQAEGTTRVKPGGTWKQDHQSYHKGIWSQTGKQLQTSFSTGAGITCLQLPNSPPAPMCWIHVEPMSEWLKDTLDPVAAEWEWKSARCNRNTKERHLFGTGREESPGEVKTATWKIAWTERRVGVFEQKERASLWSLTNSEWSGIAGVWNHCWKSEERVIGSEEGSSDCERPWTLSNLAFDLKEDAA